MKLPRLDDLDYTRLREELVAAIPRYSSNWDNFNPADPGITILELLAYVAETLLYRLNRISPTAHRNHMRLLAGVAGHPEIDAALADPANRVDPDYREFLKILKEYEGRPEADFSSEDLARMQVSARGFLSSPYRAITEGDFRVLAVQAAGEFALSSNPKPSGQTAPEERLSRAVLDEARDLHAFVREEAELAVVLVSRRHGNAPLRYTQAEIHENAMRFSRQREGADAEFESLRRYVLEFLRPRKLIGTRLQVRWAQITPLRIEVQLRAATFARVARTLRDVGHALLDFMDATAPGRDPESRWNQSVHANGLIEIVESVPDVAEVLDVLLIDGDSQPGRPLRRVKVRGFARIVELSVSNIESAGRHRGRI